MAPKAHFAGTVFDFGRIGASTIVQHSYFFTNAGTAPLVVTGVQPSCDCTTVGEWTARVDAGKSGMIPVRFDSTGYDGAIDKTVLVTTNDPAQPQVVLTLKGTVSNPIAVSPANAVFTLTPGAGARETKVIRIKNNTREPLVLSAPQCANRAFAVTVTTVSPGAEFALQVTAVPPFAAGTRVVGLITLKTNSAEVPVIAVTALAVVRKSPMPATAADALPSGAAR